MSFEIGQQVGGYEIIALLGKGGMGEVYHAKDTRLARTVAIKVLPRDTTADSEPKKRFLQEARTASALNHPNIVVLHDIANEGGRDYLVMEYVPGKSLDKLITRQAMSVQEAAGYAAQVASALTAAHAAGIVHRDIKPANLIVTPESQVKVLDFGLAKLMERRDGPDDETVTQQSMLTEAGTVMGTVAYMSPEQARGRPVDHRTDIFSLGVVLYEMLAGRRPFVSDSHVEVMNAVIKDAAPPLKNQPRELTDILDRALAKDPKDRYQHAGDLALDLRRFISRPAEVTLAAVPQLRNRKWWVAALVAAAVIALIVLAPWSRRSTADLSSNPLAGAQFTRFTDFEGLEYDAAISRDGRFVVFRSDHDGVVDTWVSQVGSGRFVNLTRGTRSSVLVPNAGFTADGSEIWLSAILGGDRLRLIPLLGGAARPFLTEHAMEPAWSPDGSKIVFHPYDTGDPLIITDKSGSNPQQIFTSGAGGHNHYPIWSLDGQWIYFISGLWDAREMDIWRIRPSGGKPEQLTNVASDVRYLAPIDDRTILYVSPDQNGAGPWLWALDTEKKQTRRISSGLEIYTSVHASADGRRLAVTVSNPTANMWSVPILDRIAEEKDVKPMSLPTVRAYAPRYGGSSLFYLSSRGGGDGLWRYVNGEATEIWRGADGALLEPPAVAFNGQRVAVILRKKGKRTLHIISSDGGDDRPLAPAIDVTSSANWSPDGKSIVVAGIDSGMPGLFNIPVDGGNPVRLVTGTASNPVWSPDGSVIAYTGPVVAVQGSLLIIRPDGTPLDTPRIQVRVNTEHYRFIPGTEQLVYIPTTSQTQPENFWLLDLTKKKTRQLANFESRPTRTFDITPDGKQIVFDRLRENSDIVLIDLPEKQR